MICSLFGAIALAQPISVSNFSFESGTDQIDHWTFTLGENGKGDWSWDTERVHDGNRSLKMTKTNVVGHSMLASEFIPVQSGKEYDVRGWISVYGRSRGCVYFMVSQYIPDIGDMKFPNAFSVPQPHYTGEGWKQISVRVKVREGNTRLRIHCLAAFAPVTVSWDDIEVVEVVPGTADYKPRYEKPVAEQLPPLEQAKAIVAKRKQATASVQVINGRARFVIDGKLTPACFYVSPFHNPIDAQIKDFRDAGVRVYLVPLILGHGVYGDKGPWLGKDRYDWREVEDLLWRVLRVDPEGYIIFYMATDPYRDWGREHPTEVCCDQYGKKSVVVMHPKDWGREPTDNERYGPSLVSSVLREDTARTLRALVKHVRSTVAGKAVIGYHVAGLNDGQFFQWVKYGPADIHLADYSEASVRALRDWLRRFYEGNVIAFQRAWNRTNVTFDNATIPSGERRLAPGFLLDTKRDQDIADYNRFFSLGTVETIAGYARVIKRETQGKTLVSTYYEDAAANVDSHLALSHLLNYKDFDFLAGPTAYGVRMPGEVGECHSTWGSVRLHNKIWLTEQDFRSWLSGPLDADQDRSVGRATLAQDHSAMVRRESGMMLAYGHGTWWYDMSGGWFRDDGIMKGVAEAVAAFKRDVAQPGVPRADMAVFISERSLDYLAWQAAGPYRYQGIVQQLFILNQCGVPYHLYLQEDLSQKNLPDYKVYVFLNPHFLSSEQRSRILSLRSDGKLLVFVHAPGVVGADSPAAVVSDVTGIKVRALPKDTQLLTTPVEGDHPLLRGLDGLLGTGTLTGPAFEVADPAATVLGTYPDGKTAVACRDFGKWKSVFFGGVGMCEQFLHNLAQWAGAWCAADPGDAVYASQYFATIHAMYPGKKTLHLAAQSKVVDLTSGKVMAERTATIDLDMPMGETRWFQLTPK
ncbi:MAG: hypothetical protein HY318_12195 [Armatimonadetes bacterium]|nr:hypothetical protein [Armatimonadota bacterium]